MIFIGRFLLQRKICVVVFSEIHGFCLERNTLAGVIFEFAAFVVRGTDSLFGTEYLVLIQIRTVQTIAAGTLYFFTKQHSNASGRYLFLHYTGSSSGFP